MIKHRGRAWVLAGILAGPLAAQPAPEIKEILTRLDRLERENQALKEEVKALREQIAAPSAAPSLEERVDVAERRIEETQQTKIESSQRLPVRLRGMILANAYYNSKFNGGVDNPTVASLATGNAAGGATFRQTTIGLEASAPSAILGATVRGDLMLDFFGGTNQPLNHLLRVRTAAVHLDWASRSVTVGQEKPIIAQRDPDSLAQVGISPLTAAGNLWLWLPQIRFEQRFNAGDATRFTAQAGVVQTSETAASVPAAFAATLERWRPGLEGRFEWAQRIGRTARFEIAPGFHRSTTHVAATSVPSSAFAIDWLVQPVERVALTGTYYNGKNLALFGIGGIRQGFTILGPGNGIPVHAQGGWAQLKLKATDRVTFHLMAGQHDDRNADLRSGGVGKNQAYGGNFYLRIAPNVLASFETLHLRTNYLGSGNRQHNHYDLGLAYLF